MKEKDISKKVKEMLELVALKGFERKDVTKLSGGQQQRGSIARSVARQPKILIADEPTANLDKLTTREVIDLLKKISLLEQALFKAGIDPNSIYKE